MQLPGAAHRGVDGGPVFSVAEADGVGTALHRRHPGHRGHEGPDGDFGVFGDGVFDPDVERERIAADGQRLFAADDDLRAARFRLFFESGGLQQRRAEQKDAEKSDETFHDELLSL